MADEKKPGYAFNYIADIGAGQQIQITGSLPVGVTQPEIETEFKKFRNVMEKHRSFTKIDDLQKSIDGFEAAVLGGEESLRLADERHEGMKNVPNNEKMARAQIASQLKQDRFQLEQQKKLLAQRIKESE